MTNEANGRREFWRSAGMHLVSRNDDGWLEVTADFLRAYYTRREVHPVAESCAREIALHERLMAEPFMPVETAQIAELADADARQAYGFVLGLREVLMAAGTIEGAYLKLVEPGAPPMPPVFLDQLVHLVLRNILEGESDPMRLRAGELFFREQSVSTEDGCIMLADEEVVQMWSRAQSRSGVALSGLGQLLAASGLPVRQMELDVLNDANSAIYWDRSDRFDTVIDFRFGQPAVDALARVIEAWLLHMRRLKVKVQPLHRIVDDDWRWHIGLDREANAFLNRLYAGEAADPGDMARMIGLFDMRFDDETQVIERVKGHPVYLALAKSAAGRLKMKPQNLLQNLPLIADA